MRKLPLLLIACAVLVTPVRLQAQQPPAPPAVQPVIHPDRTVTFSYATPAATAVAVQLEGTKDPIPMHKDEAGLWTWTSPALAPELYYYHFVLGGKSTLDPANFHIVFATNAVSNSFLVPGATPAPWEDAAIPHGTLHRHPYTTKIVQGLPQNQSEFYVYTPPGYDPKSSTKYPVLYLLHGYTQMSGDWSGFGRAGQILDSVIASGKAKPMIVVMPLGYGDMSFLEGSGVWNQPATVEHNTSLFTQALLAEVLPQAERLYNASARREDRAIIGLSMGGLESLTIGLSHPETFASVGGMSAAVHLVDPAQTAKLDPAKARLKLLWIGCGDADSLIGPNRKLAANLRQAGFNVTAQETPGGLHTWIVWRQNLVDFTQLLFK